MLWALTNEAEFCDWLSCKLAVQFHRISGAQDHYSNKNPVANCFFVFYPMYATQSKVDLKSLFRWKCNGLLVVAKEKKKKQKMIQRMFWSTLLSTVKCNNIFWLAVSKFLISWPDSFIPTSNMFVQFFCWSLKSKYMIFLCYAY